MLQANAPKRSTSPCGCSVPEVEEDKPLDSTDEIDKFKQPKKGGFCFTITTI